MARRAPRGAGRRVLRRLAPCWCPRRPPPRGPRSRARVSWKRTGGGGGGARCRHAGSRTLAAVNARRHGARCKPQCHGSTPQTEGAHRAAPWGALVPLSLGSSARRPLVAPERRVLRHRLVSALVLLAFLSPIKQVRVALSSRIAMSLKLHKRLAADIEKCGRDRIFPMGIPWGTPSSTSAG